MARLLSLAHLTVLDAHPLALLDAAEAGGFGAAGLRVVPPMPGDAVFPVIGDLPLRRAIKARLRDTGLVLLDVEAFWLLPGTDVAALLPALDLGAELGARHVLTVGNDPDRGRLRDNLGRLYAASAERGLRVMLEFIPYAAIGTLADAAALLREVAPADAGLLVDALHLARSGGTPADLAGHDPSLFSYGHLCDAPAAPPAHDLRAEARGARLLPGEGALPLRDFVAAFPPGTPMAVEAPHATRAALPATERARLAGEAARRVLGEH